MRGPRLVLQKDKDMVVKKNEHGREEAGGWGMETGRLSLESGTGMLWRSMSELKKAGFSGGDQVGKFQRTLTFPQMIVGFWKESKQAKHSSINNYGVMPEMCQSLYMDLLMTSSQQPYPIGSTIFVFYRRANNSKNVQ